MTEIDRIIAEAGKEADAAATVTTQTPHDKKPYSEVMKERRLLCYDMVENAGLDVLSDPDKLSCYLDIHSRMDMYSVRNRLLIYAQKPDAVRIRSFEDWKEDGISVKKGSKSMMILEPKKYTMADGTPARVFDPKNMFDISDTTDPPVSAYPQTRRYEQKKLVEALVHDSPVPIHSSEKLAGDAVAVYDSEKRCIQFKAGSDFQAVFPALAVALSHAEMAKGDDHYRPADHEFVARCSAYVIGKKYGVSVESVAIHSIPPKYTDMEIEGILGDLEGIHKNVKAINTRMNQVLNRTPTRTQAQTGKHPSRREERA